jgi:hypothetical protein
MANCRGKSSALRLLLASPDGRNGQDLKLMVIGGR